MLFDVTPGLLRDCTPSLMPFCISYTGPAPVSRYFLPRPAPPSLVPSSLRSSSSATTLVAGASSTSILTDTQSRLAAVSSTTSIQSLTHESQSAEDALSSTSMSRPCIAAANQAEQVESVEPVMDSETQPALDAPPLDDAHRSTAAQKHGTRFVAAFRGRQMYGQAVDVPNGYGGLVLQAPRSPNGKGKEDANKVKPKSRPRVATRRSRRATAYDGADGEDDGDCCSDTDMDPPLPAKKLVPISTFASFMLWTPDRPLDEGRDEYVRALAEWTRLAAEIHSYDEGE